MIGSQSILATYDEEELPVEATASVDVDLACFDNDDETRADQVDGAIGELSQFHETFGFYARGVSVSTAVLPNGWRDRVVPWSNFSQDWPQRRSSTPTTASFPNSSPSATRTAPSPRPCYAKGLSARRRCENGSAHCPGR